MGTRSIEELAAASDTVIAEFDRLMRDTAVLPQWILYSVEELAVLDDYEGVDVTPITRELSARNPLGLNLMRITVDGEPIDDPGRSSSDIQRCTDVALERTDIQFRFDNLTASPRLSVTARPSTVAFPSNRSGGEEQAAESTVNFRMYSNYASFIERAEVRIFEADESIRSA